MPTKESNDSGDKIQINFDSETSILLLFYDNYYMVIIVQPANQLPPYIKFFFLDYVAIFWLMIMMMSNGDGTEKLQLGLLWPGKPGFMTCIPGYICQSLYAN